MTRQPWHEDFWTDGDTGESLRSRESEHWTPGPGARAPHWSDDLIVDPNMKGFGVIGDFTQLHAPAGPPLHEPADRDGDNVPTDRVRDYVDAIWGKASTQEVARAVMAVADREQAALRATIARVEALADSWEQTPDYDGSNYDVGRVDQRHVATYELRAALRGPEPTEETS